MSAVPPERSLLTLAHAQLLLTSISSSLSVGKYKNFYLFPLLFSRSANRSIFPFPVFPQRHTSPGPITACQFTEFLHHNKRLLIKARQTAADNTTSRLLFPRPGAGAIERQAQTSARCLSVNPGSDTCSVEPWCHGTAWGNDSVYPLWVILIRPHNPSRADSLRKRPLAAPGTRLARPISPATTGLVGWF